MSLWDAARRYTERYQMRWSVRPARLALITKRTVSPSLLSVETRNESSAKSEGSNNANYLTLSLGKAWYSGYALDNWVVNSPTPAGSLTPRRPRGLPYTEWWTREFPPKARSDFNFGKNLGSSCVIFIREKNWKRKNREEAWRVDRS